MIDNRTTHFNFPLPYPTNALNEDVLRLRSALSGIDDMFNWASQLLASDDPVLGKMQALVDAAKAVDAQLAWIEPEAAATLTYNGSGQVTMITETLGGGQPRVTAYAYNVDGQVQTETVTIGAVSYVTTYTYTGGLLTGATRALA